MRKRINSSDIHDVILRVVQDMFPSVKIGIFLETIDNCNLSSHIYIPYNVVNNKPDEKKDTFGLKLETSGSIRSKDAKKFLLTLPDLVFLSYQEGIDLKGCGINARFKGLINYLSIDDKLVVNELLSRLCLSKISNNLKDSVIKLIEFIRIVSNYRYEGKSPEISIILDLNNNKTNKNNYGTLNFDLIETNKGVLSICSNGAAALEVDINGRITNIIPLHKNGNNNLFNVPERLKQLANYSKIYKSIAINLDGSPSITFIANGNCIFRFLNNKYIWVDTDLAISDLKNTIICNEIISLSCDMADIGHGGIIVLVNDSDLIKDELRKIVNEDCIPYLSNTWESSVWENNASERSRFNSWILKNNQIIADLPHSFLINIISIDGATFIDSTNGKLMGFGAVVKVHEGSPDQGSRTTAAKFLSNKFGFVIKISEDKNAILFNNGEYACRIW